MIGLRAAVGLAVIVGGAHAIGQTTCVSLNSVPSSFDFAIVANGQAAPIYYSSEDWGGVQLAITNFAADIARVTGVLPTLNNLTSSSTESISVPSDTFPILVGTLGQSPLIDAVINQTDLDVSTVQGQWEAFTTRVVSNPLPGIQNAYVMIGADKRGTIYALYDHSEQFGVSPWYWWADVPIKQHSALYVAASGCAHGSPTVKYRGIFLNDEQPALQNWAMEKFSNATGAYYTGSPFNSIFYTKLFELMLRFKANYLWPAQWSSAFAIDDPLNQYWADFYGIVMGTSHEEPIMRSTPVEWNTFGSGPWDYSVNRQNIYDFWVIGAERGEPFENIYTVGMRGLGDLPMGATTNVALLQKVISDQRQILSNAFDVTDITTIPQMWCLYKEVLGYYEAGLQVPDDVTLLWTDDNFGNVERYPLYNERNRTGGAGVYYHYDYVGDPRDYKWVTTTQMAKTYDQMSLAIGRDAVRIWVLNVGDLKPYEMQIEFFITYGWNASIWTPNNLNTFVYHWAQREFALDDSDAQTITEILANVTKYNSRRKLEMLNATTYSLVNYREAEMMLRDWDTVLNASTAIYQRISAELQPAFFELVQHPVAASHTVATMWIYAGLNNLHASQARLSANDDASKVKALFQKDYDLELEYHTLLDGKWNHMMDQTHIMYYYWQQPMQDTMPYVTYVQSRKGNLAGVMRIVPERSLGAWPGDNMNNCAQGYSCPYPTMTLDPYVPFQNRYIDVGAGGLHPFTFTVTTNVSWLELSLTTGSISPAAPEQRVYVSVNDWSQVSGAEAAVINFNATAPGQAMLNVPVTFIANHMSPASNFTGFVEGGDGVISIEAAHTTTNTSVDGISWMELPGYGRTLSGITPLPRTAENGTNFTAGAGPSVTYAFYNFNTIRQAGNITITIYVAPSLNANGDDRPLAFAIQVDDEASQTVYFIPCAAPGTLPAEWDGMDGFAATNIVSVSSNFTAPPGAHELKIWMVEPAVIIEKIVIDTGGLVPSYLGPPESIYLSANQIMYETVV